jgi:protein-disulfide isomerase
MLNTKSFATLAILASTALTMVACSPSEKQLQDVIEKNPMIVFGAIEKHPDQFMEVVQKAAQAAQKKNAENAEKKEKDRLEEEFKNPLKPEIAADRAHEGPDAAPITIVEYSDFQCPYCGRGFATLREVLKAYEGKVKFVFKNLPLPMHPMAMPAAKRFEAIALQDAGKAFKYHDEVFKNQDKLNADGEKFLDSVAKKVGADMAKLKSDMNSDKVKARIDADMKEAEKFGISGTPGFIVNGVSIRGAYPADTFKTIIDRQLATNK